MRIIKPNRVHEFGRLHPIAMQPLENWLAYATAARWSSLVDVRRVFRHADEVKVGSGRKVVIFNIKGDAFRLITAIHYNRQKVFVLLFLTHAEYSKDRWKEKL